MSKRKEINVFVYAEKGEIRTDVAQAFKRMILDYTRANPDWRERKAAWLTERAAMQEEVKAS